MKKIGIPRSLLYYKYFPLWKTFFEELGCEIVLSGESNVKMIEAGNRYAIDEICIPLKLYYGHILDLLDKEIDFLFVPRYVSLTSDTYMCPKFLALPDVIRATINDIPPLLEMDMNLRKKSAFSSMHETGRQLKKSTYRIKKAYEKAVENQKTFITAMENGADFKTAVKNPASHTENTGKKTVLKIAVIGHGYNVHDSFVNMDIIKHLEKMHAKVTVLENLPHHIFKHATAVSKSLKNYWGNEEEILSAVKYIFKNKSADGIIFLCSFCCGPDSLIDEIMTRDAREAKIPYISLVLDEHSGQAGVITRIEAFVDMIVRKNKKMKQ